MEIQNKEKIVKPAKKIRLGFGNWKIRNKIVFGFFVISVIAGLVNYYSNSFIVNEFGSINNTVHMFHNIFAKQKSLEIVLENYISSETEITVSDSQFDAINKEIGAEFGGFMRTGTTFLDKDLIARFMDKSEIFFGKEREVISAHKKDVTIRAAMAQLQAQEKAKRYEIRNYIDGLSDKELYTAFLYSEYLSKEMLYQYKDAEHAKKWLEGLSKVKEVAAAKSIEIPGFNEYYDVADKTSLAVTEVNLAEMEEQKRIKEFRASVEDLNNVQEEVSVALSNRNLERGNAVVFVGVFVFMFILLFFTVLISYFVSGFISRPIKDLAYFAMAAGKGDFHSRVNVGTDDEVGQTAEAFNLMLDKVEESTLVLEAKVSARTKRLEELSKNLEDQVNDKTKELNEKINELERFNDLAVGRELAMVELKKEMEKLKQPNNVKKGKKKVSP